MQSTKKLAEEMTRFIHGEAVLEQSIKITAIHFSGDVKNLTAAEIQVGSKICRAMNEAVKKKSA